MYQESERLKILAQAREIHYEDFETIYDLIYIVNDDDELVAELTNIMEEKSQACGEKDIVKRSGQNVYKKLQKQKSIQNKRKLEVQKHL